MKITKSDWKLFQERVPDWQERFMEKLNQEYIELLSGEEEPSERFWALEKRIKGDKNKPGVRIELRKSEVDWDLLHLMRDGAITVEDLDGFSEDLKEGVISKAKEFGIL